MSLEAALTENTAALKQVAALLEQSNSGREAAIAKLTADGAATETRTAGRPRKSAADKAAEEAAAKLAAEQAQTTAAATTTTTTAAVAPTIDDLRAAGAAFMSVAEPAKTARKEFVGSILAHLGISKVVEVAEEDRAKVIGWFQASAAGQTVNFSEGEDDTQAEDDDDMMG